MCCIIWLHFELYGITSAPNVEPLIIKACHDVISMPDCLSTALWHPGKLQLFSYIGRISRWKLTVPVGETGLPESHPARLDEVMMITKAAIKPEAAIFRILEETKLILFNF